MRIASLAATLSLGLAMLTANAVTASEINVASIPFKGPLDQIGPQFERSTGHKLTIKYAPSAPLRKQIDAGEPFDVVLIFPEVVDDLIKQGKVTAGTRMDIARAGLGTRSQERSSQTRHSDNGCIQARAPDIRLDCLCSTGSERGPSHRLA